MQEQDILAAFTRTLRDLLGDDQISLAMDTTRDEVPSWDSLNYVSFIVAVETEFAVKFRMAEIDSFVDVGAIVHAVVARGAAA
ncbi:MAG: acyl carrier protein [Pseudomonadota bacterium]|nr:acyl carrier protein [Pseudomonadota bacterium]